MMVSKKYMMVVAVILFSAAVIAGCGQMQLTVKSSDEGPTLYTKNFAKGYYTQTENGNYKLIFFDRQPSQYSFATLPDRVDIIEIELQDLQPRKTYLTEVNAYLFHFKYGPFFELAYTSRTGEITINKITEKQKRVKGYLKVYVEEVDRVGHLFDKRYETTEFEMPLFLEAKFEAWPGDEEVETLAQQIKRTIATEEVPLY